MGEKQGEKKLQEKGKGAEKNRDAASSGSKRAHRSSPAPPGLARQGSEDQVGIVHNTGSYMTEGEQVRKRRRA